MKVTTKINVFPQNEMLLGINYQVNNIVRDPNNYDPEDSTYPQAHILEIGLVLVIFKFTFWEGY